MKLFRKIRARMLSQNRISKYIIYALGEIVLVVIGILIALQINNWNEEKKVRSQQSQILIEIQSELKQALSDLKDDRDDHQRDYQSAEIVRMSIMDRTPSHDSLMNHYFLACDDEEFLPMTSAFESLKSIGLDLISSDTLRREITTAYLYIGRFSSQMESLDAELRKLITLFEEHTTLDRQRLIDDPEYTGAQWMRKRANPVLFKDYEAFLDDDRFLDTLMNSIVYRKQQIHVFTGMEEYIEVLIEHIDLELQALS